MKQVICPCCKRSPKNKNQYNYALIYCEHCYMHWTFIKESINNHSLYNDFIYRIVDNRNTLFEKIILREAKVVINKASKFDKSIRNNLLDFGCGKGHFLYQAKQMGWNTLGIETSKDRASFAKNQYGINILNCNYKKGMINKKKFDFISFNHVLEHLDSPKKTLNNLLSSNLNKKGIIYIEVPRYNSIQSFIAGRFWQHLDIPRHLTHWTEASLVKLMNEMNYRVIGKRNFSIHLGVLGMIQAICSLLGYRGNITSDLKKKKSFLTLALLIPLPIAFVAELIFSIFNRSGIIGLYFIKSLSVNEK